MHQTRLREERKKCGMSQSRLARILHVDQSSVSHWETAFSQPRPAKAAAMADIFGVPADELLSATADDTTAPTAAAPKRS